MNEFCSTPNALNKYFYATNCINIKGLQPRGNFAEAGLAARSCFFRAAHIWLAFGTVLAWILNKFNTKNVTCSKMLAKRFKNCQKSNNKFDDFKKIVCMYQSGWIFRRLYNILGQKSRLAVAGVQFTFFATI